MRFSVGDTSAQKGEIRAHVRVHRARSRGFAQYCMHSADWEGRYVSNWYKVGKALKALVVSV